MKNQVAQKLTGDFNYVREGKVVKKYNRETGNKVDETVYPFVSHAKAALHQAQ